MNRFLAHKRDDNCGVNIYIIIIIYCSRTHGGRVGKVLVLDGRQTGTLFGVHIITISLKGEIFHFRGNDA